MEDNDKEKVLQFPLTVLMRDGNGKTSVIVIGNEEMLKSHRPFFDMSADSGITVLIEGHTEWREVMAEKWQSSHTLGDSLQAMTFAGFPCVVRVDNKKEGKRIKNREEALHFLQDVFNGSTGTTSVHIRPADI